MRRIVVVLFALAACGSTDASRPIEPAPARAPIAASQMGSPAPAMGSVPAARSPATEPGFTRCCGSDSFRLEIQCEENLIRCYEHKRGAWVQTYGRHCKRELGACYNDPCGDSC